MVNVPCLEICNQIAFDYGGMPPVAWVGDLDTRLDVHHNVYGGVSHLAVRPPAADCGADGQGRDEPVLVLTNSVRPALGYRTTVRDMCMDGEPVHTTTLDFNHLQWPTPHKMPMGQFTTPHILCSTCSTYSQHIAVCLEVCVCACVRVSPASASLSVDSTTTSVWTTNTKTQFLL